MPQQKTQQLFIYRMTHIDNVPFIAQNGLWSKLSPVHDPNFIPIGNPDIIDKRTNKFVVVIPPGGVLGEYVPFYFSGHSPMFQYRNGVWGEEGASEGHRVSGM